ncbi:MAG: DUF2147 domain-containing protein [Sneathiellales bacterium]|nr:DUF2147 domain-containing protein [Sneathiellales bacterium]
MKKSVIALLSTMFLFAVTQAQAAEVVGIWETVEGKSHVKIDKCGDKFCGEIIWLKEPNDKNGKPKTDINNQNENLRGRQIVGIQLLKDLKQIKANEWDNGEIYNPEDGNTYSSEMTLLSDSKLKVEGCVLFLCKEQIWTRKK